MSRYTVKQVNFVGNLISQILKRAQIHKIKLLQNCKFSNSKLSIIIKFFCQLTIYFSSIFTSCQDVFSNCTGKQSSFFGNKSEHKFFPDFNIP